MNNPFGIPNAAVSRTVSGTSARVAYAGTGNVVRICNVGSAEAFVRSGTSAVVATTSCMSIPGGVVEVFSIPLTDTHLAAITEGGDTTLRIARGDGF